MSNDVENFLQIEGNSEEISRFFAQAKGKGIYGHNKDFTFNTFVPIPQGDMQSYEDLRDWARENWGTSSDCFDTRIKENRGRVSFTTAATVPVPVLLAMSRQFPSLKFTNEWIIDITKSAGVLVLQNGAIVSEEKEHIGAWWCKESKYIHQLNMKNQPEEYIDWLQDLADGSGDAYDYYLSLAEAEPW